MAARASTANLGLTGIPLFIAIELMLFERGEQSHEESMAHLAKAYGWLRAFLPVKFEKKPEEFTRPRIEQAGERGAVVKVSILDVLIETENEIATMYQKYNPVFEGNKSCGNEEKQFLTVMRGVFERVALVVAFSHICDRVSDSEEVYF